MADASFCVVSEWQHLPEGMTPCLCGVGFGLGSVLEGLAGTGTRSEESNWESIRR
jgi:hypothetical protein